MASWVGTAGASFFNWSSTRKTTSPSKVSVSEPKFLSKERLGAGWRIRVRSTKESGPTWKEVGIPAGVEAEYRCQPGSIRPVILRMALPPGEAAGGSAWGVQAT